MGEDQEFRIFQHFTPNVQTAVEERSRCPSQALEHQVGLCPDDEPAKSSCEEDEEDSLQRQFLTAASMLSDDELREFVDDHISGELAVIYRLPQEQRAQAFRTLCAEWHPDKCPAIAGLATEVFQRLQVEKSKILRQRPGS